jgi:hypothetical protein
VELHRRERPVLDLKIHRTREGLVVPHQVVLALLVQRRRLRLLGGPKGRISVKHEHEHEPFHFWGTTRWQPESRPRNYILFWLPPPNDEPPYEEDELPKGEGEGAGLPKGDTEDPWFPPKGANQSIWSNVVSAFAPIKV